MGIFSTFGVFSRIVSSFSRAFFLVIFGFFWGVIFRIFLGSFGVFLRCYLQVIFWYFFVFFCIFLFFFSLFVSGYYRLI